MAHPKDLKPGMVVHGSLLPEPVELHVVQELGDSVKLIGRGQRTGAFVQRVLSPEQLGLLEATSEHPPFDGDASRFWLGVEAARLGIAYEYDPYFSLSIARVDPLPHQLEAVYDYFIKQPRIRFLLADDPGAGKTIMAGLLLKELKIRGLVQRTLIVTPANLGFQWQRELKDKFRENFEIIKSSVLRANYGQNPWQEKNQVITSVSWVSVVEDAKESLLRSHWDLIIVDEAHKMSASSSDKKTLAYKLGEALSSMTDHYLLMTATPHKGDPKHFCLFLELLDRDIYGNVKSLEEAMRRNSAPFYLRRTKEALVTFPDPETGKCSRLFRNRTVETAKFELDGDEYEFYDKLTKYVEDQSIKASEDDTARGRALSFTMAMLQRRFASSVYAVRKSLERMRAKRQKILEDPEGYRKDQIAKRLPEDFEDLPEDEQLEIEAELEEVVASVDPIALKEEIQTLGRLIDEARALEQREIESKLTRLKKLLSERHIFGDPKMKLLIFTEHKDTLDYLAGDGREGRPEGKLIKWGLKTTQIHGGMKVGDRDTTGSRIWAERAFKEEAQVLVATEAAGEGINLQFCWLMVNYDIPWNPVRLEQRMGRIHRYGQEHDCLIFNFVATNTREGRVLNTLLERLKKIRADLSTDRVFDVIGEVFPANLLEKLFREMYANRIQEANIKQRIVEEMDPERFKQITSSTLEGLAKKELNLSALLGKSAEARERRLVPEIIEDFFLKSSGIVGLQPKSTSPKDHVFKIGKLPRNLLSVGERLEPRFGRLGREYKSIVFDKALLATDGTLDWVTPGHPLFEVVRDEVAERVRGDLKKGAVFYDLQAKEPVRLDVFCATIKDGRGHTINRRLFIVQADIRGELIVKQPTYLHELSAGQAGAAVPQVSDLPSRDLVERALIDKALKPFLADVAQQREKEVEVVTAHLEISLGELINRANVTLAELMQRRVEGESIPGLEGNIAQAEHHLDQLNDRLERRRKELVMEKHVSIGDIEHLGSAWVLPHPERSSPKILPMISDPETERIAVEEVIKYETARGWVVESVEADNRGFDLISRKPHPEDAKTFTDVRFIEVKGRGDIGEVGLSENEYKTAVRLKKDYWLYVVYRCKKTPEVHIIQDPAKLGWQPVVQVDHYKLGADQILKGEAK